MRESLSSALKVRKTFLLQLLTYGVAVHGLLLVATTLEDELVVRTTGHELHLHISNFTFGIPVAAGLTLLYISVYLRRRKWAAWLAAIFVYTFILGISSVRLLMLHHPVDYAVTEHVLRGIVLPLVIIGGLIVYADDFTVKSDLRNFTISARFILLLMAVMFLYGVAGFMLLDRHDFHHEISFWGAVHHTIDQFGLTTDNLVPYTRRAKAFLDSLSVVSTMSVAYGLISLFQPIRARFSNQIVHRETVSRLLRRYPANSEDFFKLWPHDKMYFFTEDQTAGIAYGTHRGVAMAVGDPFGDPARFEKLLRDFDEFCRTNDWLPAFVHTVPEMSKLFKSKGYSLQKIGEEAVLDLHHFDTQVKNNKYFRQIRNKFTKAGYTTEMHFAPHSEEFLARLDEISSEWLSLPGREERGFMMGNYNHAYMQQCSIMVLKDGDGVIQAFINQIPSFDPAEANFDLLRHTKSGLGNSNDFLLMQFIEHLLEQKAYKRLNLGLCPLSGLDETDEERSVIDSALRFVYANGDRFYSFSGLRRFKSKYEPVWSSRYIAYRGGVRSFTRILTALNKAMKV